MMNTYTVKDAKVLWCPMARQASDDGGTYNYGIYCIADDCMMWTWAGYGAATRGRGYCGLTNIREE